MARSTANKTDAANAKDAEDLKVEEVKQGEDEAPKTAEVPEEEAHKSLDKERVEVAPAASDDYRKADDFGSEYDDSPLRDTLKEVEEQVYGNVESGEVRTSPAKDNLKQI